MILRQAVDRHTLRHTDLNAEHRRERAEFCALSAAELQCSPNTERAPLIIEQLKQFQEISPLSPFLTEAPVELAHSSFLNYVWPAVSTPAAVLFNPLIHLTTPINQVQPSIWLIRGQAVNL